MNNCELRIANCELNDHGEQSVVGEYGRRIHRLHRFTQMTQI